jgi:hypothetical protein
MRLARTGEPEISPLRMAGLIGAGMAVGAFTGDVGLPPLDVVLYPMIWFVYAFLALAGAFFAVSAVLALRHVRESPSWLLGTLLGLVLLSYPPVSSFAHQGRGMERFLATADSTPGVVVNKYVRGGVRLVVEYQVDGQTYRATRSGPNPHLGTPAFSQWRRGDTIPVYHQPNAPKVVLIGERAPDRRALFESLAKAWSFWGLVLTAYLPLAVRGLRWRLPAVRTRRPPVGPR